MNHYTLGTLASISTSIFYDPRLSPADPFAASLSFLRTPKAASVTTPVRSPTLQRGIKRPFPGHDIETEIATHVHHLSPNPSLSLPPVEPSRQLSSSPNLQESSKARKESEDKGNKEDLGSSMQSASSCKTCVQCIRIAHASSHGHLLLVLGQ